MKITVKAKSILITIGILAKNRYNITGFDDEK